jgi:hypothetical protein
MRPFHNPERCRSPRRSRAPQIAAGVSAGTLLVAALVFSSGDQAAAFGPTGRAAARGHTVTNDAFSPPQSIPSDCSVDVSKTLGPWLRALPANSTVEVPSGSCYQVDEGLALRFPQGLTIDGGTFDNQATSPPPSNGHGTPRGSPVFNVLGGSSVTFENMTIEGANPGGYFARMAFAGGIELQGTSNAVIQNVSIHSTFGDGITLAPLRGGKDHNSGVIKSPVTNVTISDIVVDGAGRMGVTFSSVQGANASNLTMSNIGLDTFDVEADQSNEGAENVTIDGCTSSSPASSNFARSFFSNGGPGSPTRTGNITVEGCTMTEPQGTAAILIERPGTGTTPRGPFLFENDQLSCGQSTSPTIVACVELAGATVDVESSSLVFPSAPPIEAVYSGVNSSNLTFGNDTVTGFGSTGSVDSTSNLSVTGGSWTPAS